MKIVNSPKLWFLFVYMYTSTSFSLGEFSANMSLFISMCCDNSSGGDDSLIFLFFFLFFFFLVFYGLYSIFCI